MSAGPKLATEATFLAAYTGRSSRRDAHDREILTFALGDETYGVDIVHLREISKMRPPTELPRVPDYLLGIIALRGTVIPILDLRLRMGLTAAEPTRAARVLIVDHDDEPFGLLVDRVIKVERMASEQIETAPGGVASEYVSAVARSHDELIVLLDLAAVVSFAEEIG